MARSLWKGSITVGLVSIPIKLYAAVDGEKTVGLNMLCKADGSRIQMKVYCPVDDAIIERAATSKGYEISKDQYVVITDDEMAGLPMRSLKSVEVQQFVPISDPGIRFAEKGYYVEPEPVGRKAFELVRQVLAAKGLAAVAKISFRERERLVTLVPFENTLLLSTIHWPDEIRSTGMLDIPEAPTISAAERKMGEQLISSMTDAFDPSAFQDEYREALLALVAAKAAGQPVPVAVTPTAPAIDLMAALSASVAAKPKGKTKKGA
jgi:DNA end-binding protein Ku